MTFEMIKHNYERGLWNEQMVRVALEKEIITQDQFAEIVGAV